MKRTRLAFICPNCRGVYADAPVTSCDCDVGQDHGFWLGRIEYDTESCVLSSQAAEAYSTQHGELDQ